MSDMNPASPLSPGGGHDGNLPVSVVIISANSAQTIRRCLESLTIFDEIIVYLNRCTDRTGELCAEFENVRVIEGEFIGFGPTRNMATSYARHPWVLSIDTDEWLGDDLQRAIQKIDFTDSNRAYSVRRRHMVLGKPVTVGGVGRRKHVRLYHRDTGKYNSKPVHEKVVLKAGIRPTLLSERLWHDQGDRDREHFSIDSSAYGVSYAEQHPGKKAIHPGMALLRAWATFFKRFVLQAGFLAGWRGILIAHHAAHSVFVKHTAHYVQTKADGRADHRAETADLKDSEPNVTVGHE